MTFENEIIHPDLVRKRGDGNHFTGMDLCLILHNMDITEYSVRSTEYRVFDRETDMNCPKLYQLVRRASCQYPCLIGRVHHGVSGISNARCNCSVIPEFKYCETPFPNLCNYEYHQSVNFVVIYRCIVVGGGVIIHLQAKGLLYHSYHSSQPITAPSLSHCLNFISSGICDCMQSREGSVVWINSEGFSFFLILQSSRI